MPLISIVSPFDAISDSLAPMSPAYRNRLDLVRIRTVFLAVLACAPATSAANAASAAPCSFEAQGEGRVATVIDARSFRLADGREIKLAGIEAVSTEAAKRAAALTAIVGGRDVTLRAEDDAPDRYGRQTAFVFVAGEQNSVQAALLSRGEAFAAADIADKDCSAALLAAESAGRAAKMGIWASATATKNAESAGDILAGNGRFMLVEGRVLSVRQSGATTYLNFGRNWTRDFAVTISRRVIPSLEAAGMAPKSLENRRIRVRGFIEARTGPRIELLRAEQLELLGN
ncbi:thermonuclease family protein [Bradyrhizobium sp.]|uniref:thermonuclease family protein n=1 Tax=Bradyrhizobium sp. TaxID=376 RepID=UPI004037FB04